jgi:hypothetical protein
VIVLDRAVEGITPAVLPTLGMLDEMSLRRQRFIAVGYGTVREDKRKARRACSSTVSAATPIRASGR